MGVSDCVDSFGILFLEMGVGMPFGPPVFKRPSWVVIPLSAEADHRLDSRRDGGPHSGQPLTGADKFTIHCADGTASKQTHADYQRMLGTAKVVWGSGYSDDHNITSTTIVGSACVTISTHFCKGMQLGFWPL